MHILTGTTFLSLNWPLFILVLVRRWSSHIRGVPLPPPKAPFPSPVYLHEPLNEGMGFKPLITQSDNRYQARFGREGFQMWTLRPPVLGGQEEKPLLDFQRECSPGSWLCQCCPERSPQHLAEAFPMTTKWKMAGWPCSVLALDSGQSLSPL